MDIAELRMRRMAARITGQLLATRARIDRSKISNFERGLAVPTQAEMERLERALAQLETAKRKVAELAVRVGLPAQGL